MAMKNRSLTHVINLTLIALTAMAIHHCLSAWKTGDFRVPPEIAPRGGGQRQCHARNIDHAVNDACTDGLHRCDADFRYTSHDVQARMIDRIHCMIPQRIPPAGMDPALA